jgi:hypothetical protein
LINGDIDANYRLFLALGLCPAALRTELRSRAELVAAIWAELRHELDNSGLNKLPAPLV